MKVRFFAFLAILVLVAGLVPVAAAQDDTSAQINCLNLSKDDCTIVQTSLDNLNKIDSLTPSFSLTEAIAGAEAVAPGMGLDSSADIKGSGALVLDRDVLKSDTPYKGATMSFDITGTSNMNGKDTPVDASIALVDGVLYWKDSTTGDWKGVAVADIKDHAADFMTAMMSMNSSSSGMMGGMMGSMMPAIMGQMGQMNGANPGTDMSAMGDHLTAMLQIPGFVKQERLDDADLLGQKMAVFAYTGDIGVLLKSKDFQKTVNDAMSSMSSGAQSGGAGGQMALMIPALLESTTGTVKLTRWIGTDDQFIHQVALDVDCTIDLFGSAASANSKATPIPPITLKVNVTFTMDKINSTTAPTAPDGATIIPADSLFPKPESTPEATPA